MVQICSRKSLEPAASLFISLSHFPGTKVRLLWTALGNGKISELTKESPKRKKARSGKSARTLNLRSLTPASRVIVKALNTVERKLEKKTATNPSRKVTARQKFAR